MDAKTIAATVMAVIAIAADWLGWKVWSFLTEEWVLTAIGVLMPIVVWFAGRTSSDTPVETRRNLSS